MRGSNALAFAILLTVSMPFAYGGGSPALRQSLNTTFYSLVDLKAATKQLDPNSATLAASSQQLNSLVVKAQAGLTKLGAFNYSTACPMNGTTVTHYAETIIQGDNTHITTMYRFLVGNATTTNKSVATTTLMLGQLYASIYSAECNVRYMETILLGCGAVR
ncbi:hypothetical protein SeLEV6574_g04035 [Synchytrium endobioticum]|uniref:Uncharacterized protein n=1 Tax=Synchytrium endobioticum TaxID=286115 RepID=A0A507D1N8_9FUNG|nr:hypothetical protein SeLEV6574_g04035 [Synchytrium endobioticum]